MSTLYGNQYNNAYVAQPSVKIPPGDVSGDVKLMYFDFTITAAPTNGDIIKVGKLPAGAKILDALLQFPDLGTAGILDFGWAVGAGALEAADDNSLLVSVDVNTAADSVSMKEQMAAGGSNAAFLHEMLEEVDAQIKVTTAWTVTTGTIKGYVQYVTV
jgi:hypothetical protein